MTFNQILAKKLCYLGEIIIYYGSIVMWYILYTCIIWVDDMIYFLFLGNNINKYLLISSQFNTT